MNRVKGKSTMIIFVIIFMILTVTSLITVKNTQELAEQSKELSQQDRDYTLCLADLFATYTQNQKPITTENLNRCLADTESQAIDRP